MSQCDFSENPAELAALYASGNLPPQERARYEAHVASGCEVCRAELAPLGPVVAKLFASVAARTPPAKVRDALLERIAALPQAAPVVPPASPVPDRPPPGIYVQRDTEATWRNTPISGIRLRILHLDPASNRCTLLVRMAPGNYFPEHAHSAAEESLVLEGDLRSEDVVLQAGDYQRAEAGSHHGRQRTEQGCLVLVICALSDIFAGPHLPSS